MLRNRLFKAFAILVVVFGAVCSVVGRRMIQSRVVAEAQTRVQLDLRSVWAQYRSRMSDVETILRLLASGKVVWEGFHDSRWDDEVLRNRLEIQRRAFNLDFVTVVDASGRVVLRTASPYRRGDYRSSHPLVSAALRGQACSGTEALPAEMLELEAEGLAGKAFIHFEETLHAAPCGKREETQGMAIMAAVPVVDGATVVGAVYGGILVSRDNEFVDRAEEIVFAGRQYRGAALGTVTVFLGDCRVATTVRKANGNRAVGTRVSKEVAEQVLDNGRPWAGPAFVVNERYLAAYDPIRDSTGKMIGMLYVGILERPFREMGRAMMVRYGAIVLAGLMISVALAFFLAHRIANPLHRLAGAADRLRRGGRPEAVEHNGVCDETAHLIKSFNEMAATLVEREHRLKETNDSLESLNRSYMEMLGFVAHELKSPVSTIMNYAYLLKSDKLGDLTERQRKAVRLMDSGAERIAEMVRHYLNLSRIESGEMNPVQVDVAINADVLDPLLESLEHNAREVGIRIENRVGADVVVHADPSMTREVLENLLHNAVKYGRADGRVTVESSPAGEFVEFSVFNEGVGIPEDKIGSVFGKFVRINGEDPVHRRKGTGLGLFITRHIVEAHGGRISVESKYGEWARFRFTLPRHGGAAAT